MLAAQIPPHQQPKSFQSAVLGGFDEPCGPAKSDAMSYAHHGLTAGSKPADSTHGDSAHHNYWPVPSNVSSEHQSHAGTVSSNDHTYQYSLPEEGSNHQSLWSSTGPGLAHTRAAVSQAAPPIREYYPLPSATAGLWGQPKCEENYELDSFVTDFGNHPQVLPDQDEGILDLRYRLPDAEDERSKGARRMSSSSFSMSSNEAPMEKQVTYEDPSGVQEATSDISYPSQSLLNVASNTISSTPSPQAPLQRQRALTTGHPRTSRSPRPNLRAAPYPMARNRANRWSTGSCGPVLARQSPPLGYPGLEPTNSHGPSPSPYQSPAIQRDQGSSYGTVPAHQQSYFTSPVAPFTSQAAYYQPPVYQSQYQQPEAAPPLMSHGYFRMLQSNADQTAHQHYHYADLSDPPDLSACLHDEQVAPPPEDMNPSDPDLVPHEQELRFDGDLYTPRWVRGQGNKREGWCGICKPGRWLVLKNSAFWYDKSFSHGISAASGNQFQAPQRTRRMDGNPDVWEGLCGSCNEWIALVSSKKKGTTWWRHCYKCHTHQKVKDAPKKRREGSHSRMGSGDGTSAKLKQVSSTVSATNGVNQASHPHNQSIPTASPLKPFPHMR
ncbi:MAG: hypothetical protein M1825_006377 [Sarcosagium campestre]|nr:MAG: hypothetical protein M1825_006377 [Sarcosagium campestre]